jgi:hypothetical protein
MNKWLFLAAAFGGLLACSDQDLGEEESPDLMAQQTAAADAGAAPVTPATGLDGSVAITPTADGGAAPAPSGDIGSACVGDTDCATGTKCVKQVNIPIGGASIVFPNGYCSKNCTADAQCATGTACPLAGAAAFLPDISQCLKVCKASSECRQGYSCTSLPPLPFGGSAGPAATHCLPPLPAVPGFGG